MDKGTTVFASKEFSVILSEKSFLWSSCVHPVNAKAVVRATIEIDALKIVFMVNNFVFDCSAQNYKYLFNQQNNYE